MTARHTLLVAGGVLVLGMAIYLVREVSRTPSDAQARTERRDPPAPPPVPERRTPDPRVSPPTKAVLPSTDAKLPVANPPTNPDERPAITEVQPPATAQIVPPQFANPKLDAIMGEANRAYDQGEFDEAKQIAVKVLEKAPGNVRMLRIIVSSECIAGDAAESQKYFAQLPVGDRAQMRMRCERYGVTLKDP